MSAALGRFLLAQRREQAFKQSFGHISVRHGAFPHPVFTRFPLFKKGVLLSFIRTFPLTEVRSKVITHFNGTFCLRHGERGKSHIPATLSVAPSLKGCSLWDDYRY